MHDFSQYGGIAPDWERLMATQPDLPPAPELSPTELRAITNQQREVASRRATESIDDVLVEDHTILRGSTSLVLRVYRKTPATDETSGQIRPIYVWYHGGGFLFGSLDGEGGHCFNIARKLNIIVVHVCYRHTPEYQWPTQSDDALAGLDWVYENMHRLNGDKANVLVAGRSAGGCLAAGVVLRDRIEKGRTRVKGQILDIPLLCHTSKFPTELIKPGKLSSEENQDAPILPADRLALFESLIGDDASDSRYYNVLLEDEALGHFEDLPPAHLHIAGRDVFRDQGFLYVEKLKRLNVPVSFDVYPGIPHGFRRYGELEASKQWDKDHLEAIRRLLQLP